MTIAKTMEDFATAAARAGGLGGTYAGNPLSCAAALAVLDVFESESLVERAAEGGVQMREALLRLQARVPAMGDVRGLGCMLAMEFVADRATKRPDAELAQRVVDSARAHGLLLLECGPHKNVVRRLPPLTIAAKEMASGIGLASGIVVLSVPEPVLGDPLVADGAHIGALAAALPRADQRDDAPDERQPGDDPDCVHERTPSTARMTSESIVPPPAELVARRP